MSTIPRPAYSVSVQQEAADRAAARRRHLQARAGKLFVFALLILGTIITTLPFAWLVSTSLKSQAQVFTYPPEWIPGSDLCGATTARPSRPSRSGSMSATP